MKILFVRMNNISFDCKDDKHPFFHVNISSFNFLLSPDNVLLPCVYYKGVSILVQSYQQSWGQY